MDKAMLQHPSHRSQRLLPKRRFPKHKSKQSIRLTLFEFETSSKRPSDSYVSGSAQPWKLASRTDAPNRSVYQKKAIPSPQVDKREAEKRAALHSQLQTLNSSTIQLKAKLCEYRELAVQCLLQLEVPTARKSQALRKKLETVTASRKPQSALWKTYELTSKAMLQLDE